MERKLDKDIRATFWRAFHTSPVVMMRLVNSTDHPEPMTAQLDRDAHHAIWFYTRRNNRIAAGGRATGEVATFQHEVFASLSGTLSEETDPGVRERHWSNAIEAWFPDGMNDPDVIMLRFDIDDAEVWTAHIGVKGTFRLLTGKPIDQGSAGEHAVGNV
jgi:general stress protein 26